MGKTVVLAVLLACAPGIGPQPALARAAASDAEVERFDNDKFWAYAGCAASIVFASSTQQWYVAAIGCGTAISKYWTD